MRDKYIIGVLGGMGTYATVHMFKQYAETFPAEKEWDRPRIIIDNRCTMPSRVRAYLYGEEKEKLVEEMADSLRWLLEIGCSRIILACNTSHLFLPDIYKKVDGLENKISNIIECCIDKIVEDKIDEVFLLGSEGTIDSQIYQNALKKANVKCLTPHKMEYAIIRECIECVKQNRYDREVEMSFIELINRHDACILGCTELPILYEKLKKIIIHAYQPSCAGKPFICKG